MTNDKSLISELLTIYHGKFVVRVAVQVDGVVRATGMAAAESLEVAEDRARERAIAYLVNSPSLSPPTAETISALPTPPEIAIAKSTSSLSESYDSPNHTESQLDFSHTPELESPAKEPKSISPSPGGKGKSKPLSGNPAPTPQAKDIFGADLFTASSSNIPLSTDSELTANLPLNYESRSIPDEPPIAEIQAIDLTENLQKIEVKLKELRLKANDERECLEINYGKSSRYELTSPQAQEFNHYLELYSQTTQAVKELQELGWDAKEGPKYLQEQYSKNKRHQLTTRELQGFLKFLQSERDRIGVK